jgi:hypothetical protein
MLRFPEVLFHHAGALLFVQSTKVSGANERSLAVNHETGVFFLHAQLQDHFCSEA